MFYPFRRLGLAAGLVAGLWLAGCTPVVQPPEPSVLQPEMAPSPMTIELPDGSLCRYAGMDTVTVEGKPLSYTCDSPAQGEADSLEIGLLGDLVSLEGTEWQVEKATLQREGDTLTLVSSEPVLFTAWLVTLADGTVCLHAGFGATLDFDGQRLNYTCDPATVASTGADELALFGPLTPADDGVWLTTAALLTHGENGFQRQAAVQTPVARLSGLEPAPAAEVMAAKAAPREDVAALAMSAPAEAASEPLALAFQESIATPVGITWEWQQTQYGDGTLVMPTDPSRYTITLNPDGNAAIQLDCNRGRSTYTLEGDSLTFAPIASTLMACPEDSQAHVFAQDLAKVINFTIVDGALSLGLAPEAAIMTFLPADASATGEEAPMTTPPMTSTDTAGNPLAETAWQWQETTYTDGAVVTAQDPARYRLIFLADGRLNAQVDCNRGMGSYTVEGDALTFSPIGTTRMLCPEGSQGEQFLEELAAVNGYELAGDTLSLQTEGGVMTFQRAE